MAATATTDRSFATPVEPPLTVEDPDRLDWADACDVLVIGWGAAGACAALEARAAGADVIVADRFTGGGASAKSGGVVYAGGGTRHQAAAGFTDSPEAMFDYLRHEVQGVVSDETLRDFCRTSAANLAWLESWGAPYTHTMPPGARPPTRRTAITSIIRATSWCRPTAARIRRPRAATARWARAMAASCSTAH